MSAKRRLGSRKQSNGNLNDRHRKFIDSYLVCLNAVQAAREAGYTERSANGISHEIRWHPAVDAEISRRMARASRIADVNATRLLHEFACVAFANVQDFIEADGKRNVRIKDLQTLTRDQLAAVSELTVETTKRGVVRTKLKLIDKLEAGTQLGRYLKLFKEGERELSDREIVFNRALSAVDELLAGIIAGAATQRGARTLPNGPVLPVEVLPPQT